jgi:hypothetical protein
LSARSQLTVATSIPLSPASHVLHRAPTVASGNTQEALRALHGRKVPPSPCNIYAILAKYGTGTDECVQVPPSAVSGTESDSDTVLYTDNNVLAAGAGVSSSYGASVQVQPLLSSIAERRSASGGEDSEDEDADEEEGGWKTTVAPRPQGSAEESVIKAGYLWKKGERRKVCWSAKGPAFVYLTTATPDVEEALVRPAPGAPRVLQNRGRVPAPAAA